MTLSALTILIANNTLDRFERLHGSPLHPYTLRRYVRKLLTAALLDPEAPPREMAEDMVRRYERRNGPVAHPYSLERYVALAIRATRRYARMLCIAAAVQVVAGSRFPEAFAVKSPNC